MRRIIIAVLTLVAGVGIASLSSPIVSAQSGAWGTIRGRIVWAGKALPAPQAIAAVKTHMDGRACTMDGKVDVKDETYVVNPANKGLRWTFVWLAHEDTKNKGPLPTHPDLKEIKTKEVAIDQPLCAFVPHALAMREGQTLLAKNSAKIPHSFKWIGGQGTANAGGNITVQAQSSVPIKGLVADKQLVQIECAFHPWMKAALLVFNHPYYTLTDDNGAFEMKNAPAGTYRLMVRHATGIYRGGAAGRAGQLVNIKPGGTVDLGNLEFAPPVD
jgi:hypothetical protein